MDDCVSGANDEEKAIKLAKDVKYVLGKSCFDLCKWRSNSKRLTDELGGEDDSSVSFDDLERTSLLGLKWSPKTDEFTFEVNDKKPKKAPKHVLNQHPTKRDILSKISQMFDPIGLISPVIIMAKMLVQTIWRENLDWDDPVPTHIEQKWDQIWSSIKVIEQLRIPRWLGMENDTNWQLHGFADSSVEAYGAAIYMRVTDLKGKISCNLLIAKSKVTPLKTVTIPRLELAAAELLSNLYLVVSKSMCLEAIPYYLWSDNTTALQWMNKPLHELKIYVANRVRRIRENTKIENWFHVRTAENPADLVSRGLLAKDIINKKLWWQGPSWLIKPQEHWPQPLDINKCEHSPEAESELKVLSVSVIKPKELDVLCVKSNERVPLIEYSKNLSKIIGIAVYVFRFIRLCRSKKKLKPLCVEQAKGDELRKLIVLPSEDEKCEALRYFIHQEQRLFFAREYAYLSDAKTKTEKNEFPNGSKIINLRPFLDEQNIIRASGRIGGAELSFDEKHPVILHKQSRLSRLLIFEAHHKTAHGGAQLMLQYIRHNYWIPSVRNELKGCIEQCVRCQIFNQKRAEQLMADLPTDRITKTFPFMHTGVDYAGPFEVTEHHTSRAKRRKCWVAIFVCLVTRAVHIELVQDNSASSFITCFENFVNRRGHCNKLYSDNGKAFVGANKELKVAFQNWTEPDNLEKINHMQTKWIFMTPAAPHQGGIYEAAVKSAKHHIKRVIGEKHLSYVDFENFLIKVEAILNSRPLYAPTDDPLDARVITPAHFLIGRPIICPPPIFSPRVTNYSLQRIRVEQHNMLNHFWKSWSADYLSSLLPRKKWLSEKENIKIGQTVLIVDEDLAPGRWKMATICELLPSKDGFVRNVVVEIANRKKPKKGEEYGKQRRLTRAVQKLCILPIEPLDYIPVETVNNPNVLSDDESEEENE